MKAAVLAAGGVVRRALTPAAEQGTVRGLVLDLTRSRRELLVENMLGRSSEVTHYCLGRMTRIADTDRRSDLAA